MREAAISGASKIMIRDSASDCYTEPAFVLSAWCPACGGRLRVRDGRRGLFVGRDRYPACRFTSLYDDVLPALGARIQALELGNELLRRCPPAPGLSMTLHTLDRELVK